MLLCVAFFMLLLTTNSLSTPLHKSRHHLKHINWASRKFLTRRSPSLPNLDRDAALAAQAATRRKFRNAPALLAGKGISPGYAVPSSLQNTYDRASDYATNIAFLSSQPKSSTDPPSCSPSAVRVAGAGTVGNANNTVIDPLSDETDGADDFEYFGPLHFGSQAQTLQIDFDTGSADLWVPVNCSSCSRLTQFQPNTSTTYHGTSSPFTVSYGSGDVSGFLAKDKVGVGSLEVLDQWFGAVASVSENFATSPNDGLAGLAFGTIANSHHPTLFENLIPQLQAPLFSVYMTRTQIHGAEICFGGIDVSKAREKTVSWVPLVSKTYWTVNMTGVSVNNELVPTGGLNAIIDTGTSFIYFPDDVAATIYDQIPGSVPAPDYGDGFYAYPCDTPIAVSFVLGLQTLTLDPRDMDLGSYLGGPTGSMCIGAIVGAEDFYFVILGDSFLKRYVSIYDYSHGARVGFVKSINE